MNSALASGKHLLFTPACMCSTNPSTSRAPAQSFSASASPRSSRRGQSRHGNPHRRCRRRVGGLAHVRRPLLVVVAYLRGRLHHRRAPRHRSHCALRPVLPRRRLPQRPRACRPHRRNQLQRRDWRPLLDLARRPRRARLRGLGREHRPNGLVVNGDHVTMYGLFNEHFQQYQTLWNGEHGRTYFFQCESPYDAPDQAAYMSENGTRPGYAAYKVADHVDNHFATAFGIYDVLVREIRIETP